VNMPDKFIDEYWHGKQLRVGAKGGKYYINENGNKIYVNDDRRNRKHRGGTSKKYRPPTGAFGRFLKNQLGQL